MIAPLVASLLAATSPCTANDIQSSNGMLQGATGTMLGAVYVRNVARTSCVLGGRPRVQISNQQGRTFVTRERTFALRNTGGRRRPTLAPQQTAVLHLDWTNWCGTWSGPVGSFRRLYIRVTLSTGSRLRLPLVTGRPRCDQPQAPSLLYVSAFVDG
jgi:Protein of unknown function (DUF4232)